MYRVNEGLSDSRKAALGLLWNDGLKEIVLNIVLSLIRQSPRKRSVDITGGAGRAPITSASSMRIYPIGKCAVEIVMAESPSI